MAVRADTAGQRGKEGQCNKWFWFPWLFCGKKGNSPTSSYSPKSIPDGLNTKMLKTKLTNLKGNIGEYLSDLGKGTGFLNKTEECCLRKSPRHLITGEKVHQKVS